MSTIAVGPADGALLLHTTREGLAGRIGHDLTILVGRWQATLELTGDVAAALRLTAEVASLQVVEGRGGLKPLTDSDRTSISQNAQKTLQANKFAQITFEAAGAVPATPEGVIEVAGELTIAGSTRPLTVTVVTQPADGGTRATAEVEVAQTDFGVKPYSAMLGQLKVADVVRLVLDVVVPSV